MTTTSFITCDPSTTSIATKQYHHDGFKETLFYTCHGMVIHLGFSGSPSIAYNQLLHMHYYEKIVLNAYEK